MPSDTVSIPREEYNLLLKCKHIVESEFEERFSKEFVNSIKASEKAYKEGRYARFSSVREAKAFFDKV